MTQQMTTEETVITLAASVADRAKQLISDGWVKGRLYDGVEGVQEFCIHGALNFAIDELFGPGSSPRMSHIDGMYVNKRTDAARVHDMLVMYLVDEAKERGFEAPSLFWGIAAWNDAEERSHEEVVDLIGSAAQRLWSLVEPEEEQQVSWAEEAVEQKQPVYAYA